jgi:hypothetical protein
MPVAHNAGPESREGARGVRQRHRKARVSLPPSHLPQSFPLSLPPCLTPPSHCVPLLSASRAPRVWAGGVEAVDEAGRGAGEVGAV